jgi:hypothetical protein
MRRHFRFLLPAGLLALFVAATPAAAGHGNADQASPNMFHVGNAPTPAPFLVGPANEVRFNSDLAFWDAGGVKGGYTHFLAQGNYDGFRLVDVSDPTQPTDISVVECRANQGDVSFYQAENRLLLIQSIEEPVVDDSCATARDTPIVAGTNPVTNVPSTFRQKGHEGLRIFDVSNPEAPIHIATVRTACGSHTHTTIRDDRNQRAIVYVSSYPSGLRVTRREDLATLPQQPNCVPDHNKISIVEIPDKAPETAHVLKEQPLDADTAVWTATGNGGSPVRGCHDITVFEFSDSRKVAGAACLSEGQLWDVSDPANPTTAVPGQHTHIRNPFIDGPTPPQRGLFHTASFTWDGDIVLFTDEWAGGGAHGCDGPQDTRGNVWFYDNVPPGAPAPLRGRYILPRPQPAAEVCTQHNGNVVPTNDAYIGVSSAYQGGTTVFDFSDVKNFPAITDPLTGTETIPTVATEVAFYDSLGTDGRGRDDVWSTYWHNDYLYATTGIRAQPPRGLDIYKILLPDGQQVPQAGDMPDPEDRQFRARKFRYQNPQTQEAFQNLGR